MQTTDCSLALFYTALTVHRICRISNVIYLQLGITLMNLSTRPTGHKVPLNMKVQALISTQRPRQVSIKLLRWTTRALMTRKWVLATLQKMSRPWQMSQQRGELLSVYGCSSYTRSRVWHQTRASTSGNWCKQGRREARAPLELLVQDLQLPALPEAPPDAQLLEGGMSAPDSASAAEEDLPTSVKALLGPGKPILPSTQHHAWPHC